MAVPFSACGIKALLYLTVVGVGLALTQKDRAFGVLSLTENTPVLFASGK